MSIIQPGALARVIADHGEPNGTGHRVGDTFTVADYVSADDAEDGIAFYWGDSNGGFNNVTVLARYAVQIKSAAEMRARKIPTGELVMSRLHLLDAEDMSLAEYDKDGASAEVYGKTADGLPFGFKITVTDVWQVDE